MFHRATSVITVTNKWVPDDNEPGKFVFWNFINPSSHFLEYATRKVQENEVGLKLNVIHEILIYTDDVNLLDDSVNTIKENTETLLEDIVGILV
jgi:hypothetical protein